MGSPIVFENVSKRFILQHQRSWSFQEAVVNIFSGRKPDSEDFWALKDVNFEVGEGESLGIVGRNGSGKSTILKLMTRILEPTSGKVNVDGKVSALIELGAGFHPDLTGRENIYLNGSILGLGRKQMNKMFDGIVAFSELERFIDTPVRHYSSGMYARLGFSVAISVEPDILIIDEVLSVGDESFQRKCMEKIREFKSRGVSIVFVSHSLDSVKSLCDKAIWLDAGVVKSEARASQVVDTYLVDSNAVDQARAEKETVTAVAPTKSEKNRWGSREVEITGVQFLDENGRARKWCVSGETLLMRIKYLARQEIPDPVFGIAIYTSDGTQITGPNTSASGYSIEKINGEGWVDYIIDNLPLVPGAYDLSVSVSDSSRTHTYDHHHRQYDLEVHRGALGDDQGLIRIPCRWEHASGGLLLASQLTKEHRT